MPETLSLSFDVDITSEIHSINENLVEITQYYAGKKVAGMVLDRRELEVALKLLDKEKVEVL